MKKSFTVLICDDYKPWREFVRKTLKKNSNLTIVGEAVDGVDAVQKARELHPDVALIDLGLPALNGMEAARRIREACPATRILIVSELRDLEVVEAALGIPAAGYIVKVDTSHDLLPAIEAALQGRQQFVSPRLSKARIRELRSGSLR
jgi:DNA-binding NarL/FixJ family response regulator